MATPRDSEHHPDHRIERAREVVRLEAKTIAALEPRLDARFSEACEEVLRCEGHIVVSGMGKAGLIGQKISATLASTGTPSANSPTSDILASSLSRMRMMVGMDLHGSSVNGRPMSVEEPTAQATK